MWVDITTALASALIGTYFGTFFLAKREENKVKKVRAIAIRALEIIKGYAKYNGTYNKACQELNTKLNIAEKRAVIVALHKVGLPIQTPVNTPFDIKNIQLNNDVIDKDFLDDAKNQIDHGYCDHLFYEDPDKYFSENLRIETLRSLARRFIDNTLGHSTYKKDEEMIYYPESWLTSYSWGEKKAIWVFKCQVTSNMYFHKDGTPNKDKLDELIYKHSYCIETANITAIPIYHLQPNTRIHIYDKDTHLEGDYIISRMTIPLTYNGTMSITATKAAETLL